MMKWIEMKKTYVYKNPQGSYKNLMFEKGKTYYYDVEVDTNHADVPRNYINVMGKNIYEDQGYFTVLED